MAELSSLMEKYDKSGHLQRFMQDYLAVRDICLENRNLPVQPITEKNLEIVMEGIIAGLYSRLAQLSLSEF